MEKLTITKDIIELDLDRLSIDGAIDYLKELKERYENSHWSDLEISEDSCYEGGYILRLHGRRLETDAEYKNRLGFAKEVVERKKARDLAEYQRLKAIFGPNA
jgi:hypothetical protein